MDLHKKEAKENKKEDSLHLSSNEQNPRGTEEKYEVWKSELSITTNYNENSCVYIAENLIEIEGYFSIVKVENDFCAGSIMVKKGCWLEHICIKPQYIKTGIGDKLITYSENYCKNNNIKCIYIFADLNLKCLYDELGAKYLGDSLSSMGDRIVSIYEINLE